MNVIRVSDRNLVKVTLIPAINCLVVPSPIELHEGARQLLLSEVSENQQRRINNLLIQMITVL